MIWIRRVLIVIILAALLMPVRDVSAGTFAGQNGRIVFGKTTGGIWTASQNGGRAELLSSRTASSAVWSPDGMRIALVEPRQNNTTRLRVMNIRTGAVQMITHTMEVSDSEPVWSYDGTHIAFVRTKQKQDGIQSAVFTIRLTIDDLKNVSGWSAGKTYRVPTWPPDGKRLAYEEMSDGNNARILIKNLINGGLRELTALSDVSHLPLLTWSPNGKKLLFNDSDGQVYTIWADGTHRTVISDGDSYEASWSPNGDRIAFLEDFTGESISVSEPDGTIRYLPINLDGYNHIGTPTWSPDGKQLVFTARRASAGTQDLFSIAITDTALPYKIASNVTDVIAWQAVIK